MRSAVFDMVALLASVGWWLRLCHVDSRKIYLLKYAIFGIMQTQSPDSDNRRVFFGWTAISVFYGCFIGFGIAFFLGESSSPISNASFYTPGLPRTILWFIMGVTEFGSFLGWILSLTYFIQTIGRNSNSSKWTLDQSLALSAILAPFITFAVIFVLAFVEFANTTRWNWGLHSVWPRY